MVFNKGHFLIHQGRGEAFSVVLEFVYICVVVLLVEGSKYTSKDCFQVFHHLQRWQVRNLGTRLISNTRASIFRTVFIVTPCFGALRDHQECGELDCVYGYVIRFCSYTMCLNLNFLKNFLKFLVSFCPFARISQTLVNFHLLKTFLSILNF